MYENYPVRISINIYDLQETFSFTMYQATILASYLATPTNRNTPKQIRLCSSDGMVEFRHTGYGTVAFEYETGDKFQLSEKNHIAVASAINAAMQKHSLSSSQPNHKYEPCFDGIQNLYTDPFDSVKKRTNDNLRGVFE